jgi:tRNA splicing ligase
MEVKVGCCDYLMIGTLLDGLTFCLIGIRPFPNTPLLSNIQGKKILRKGDQYYWVSVHENPRGSQKVNTIIMGVRNNFLKIQEFLDVFSKKIIWIKSTSKHK